MVDLQLATQPGALSSRRFEVDDSLDGFAEVQDLFVERGWTDGLPIVPPSERRVREMLDGANFQADVALGAVPPRMGVATVEKVAINAVMAGCKPTYFPVVVAAVQALLEPDFNLNGVQSTTHVSAPLLIVNGPLARSLEVNGKHNCFGQGWRANATIGRAIRLVLINIGGGLPGAVDKATFGHPGKYTFCIAENEDENPWQALHVERGIGPDVSAVTVFAGESPHNIIDNRSQHGQLVLNAIAGTMTTLGSNNAWYKSESIVVLGPEHARMLADEGWSKTDVKDYLFQRARIPLSALRTGGGIGVNLNQGWPKWLGADDESSPIPVAGRPEDIVVIVAGGPGRHSLWLPGWGSSRSVTRPITHAGGEPVRVG
jgi:hypothetical protein